MPGLTKTEFLKTLDQVFESNRDALVRAFADSRSTPTEDEGPYLVEIDPLYFSLHCVSADAPLINLQNFPNSDAEAYESAGIDIYAVTMDSIWCWIADCWAVARGADVFPRAFANIHGYYDEYYDLSSREWTPAAVVFAEGT